MQDTAREVGTNSYATYSSGPFHMDEQRQGYMLEPKYHCSVPIQDVALKTYREQWTRERGAGEGQADPCWRRDTMMMMIMRSFI